MSRIRVCPSPIKNETHWDILSEQKKKQLTLHFQEMKPARHQQTSSTPMLKVWSVVSELRSIAVTGVQACVISRSCSLSVQSGQWKSQLSLQWHWKAIPTVYTDKCANPSENNTLKEKGKQVKTWWIYKGLYSITPSTIKWKSLFTYSVLFLKIYIV